MPVVRIIGDDIKWGDKVVCSMDDSKQLLMQMSLIWKKVQERMQEVHGPDTIVTDFQVHAVVGSDGKSDPKVGSHKCGDVLEMKKSLKSQSNSVAIWLRLKDSVVQAKELADPKKQAKKEEAARAEKEAALGKKLGVCGCRNADNPYHECVAACECACTGQGKKEAKPEEKKEDAGWSKKPKDEGWSRKPKEAKETKVEQVPADKKEQKKEEKQEKKERGGYSSETPYEAADTADGRAEAVRQATAALTKDEGLQAAAQAAIGMLLQFAGKDEVREALKNAMPTKKKDGSPGSPKGEKKEKKEKKEEGEDLPKETKSFEAPLAALKVKKKDKEEKKEKEKKPAKPKQEVPKATKEAAPAKFKEGAAVSVNDDGDWCDGTIKKVRGDGTYDVDIDGDLVPEVPEEDIKIR